MACGPGPSRPERVGADRDRPAPNGSERCETSLCSTAACIMLSSCMHHYIFLATSLRSRTTSRATIGIFIPKHARAS